MTLKNKVAAALLSITLFQGVSVLESDCSLNKKIETGDYSLKFIEELQDETGKNTTDEETLFILNGAYENDDLSNDEKALIYDFNELLDDNPYLEKENSYEKLKDVSFLYYGDDENGLNGTMGKYLSDSNTIKLYSNEKYVKTHEIMHCIFQKKPKTNFFGKQIDNENALPLYFDEGMTELLNNEYFSDKPFLEDTSYPYEITAIKLVADMIGSNKILEAYTKRDMEIINESLYNELGSHNFFYSLENIITKYESGSSVAKEDIDSLLKISNSYMKDKYGEDSQDYKAYEYNTKLLKLLSDEEPNKEYVNFIIENGSYTKPYFSSKLKSEYASYEPIQYVKK